MRSLPRLKDARELLRLPRVRIEMYGDARARDLFQIFTRRHARWRLIRNKAWGVALLALPADRGAYDRQASRLMRRQVRSATKAGMSVSLIEPLQRVDEILAIHRSTPERQGRPMHPDYFDEQRVRAYLADTALVFGVVDARGVLQAYLCLRECGEVVCLERLLGDAATLDLGTMYLLFSGVVDWWLEHAARDTNAHWLMYDMFSGASPGLQHFKHVIGLRPYRVTWSWRD